MLFLGLIVLGSDPQAFLPRTFGLRWAGMALTDVYAGALHAFCELPPHGPVPTTLPGESGPLAALGFGIATMLVGSS
jgi:hypothetical protein